MWTLRLVCIDGAIMPASNVACSRIVTTVVYDEMVFTIEVNTWMFTAWFTPIISQYVQTVLKTIPKNYQRAYSSWRILYNKLRTFWQPSVLVFHFQGGWKLQFPIVTAGGHYGAVTLIICYSCETRGPVCLFLAMQVRIALRLKELIAVQLFDATSVNHWWMSSADSQRYNILQYVTLRHFEKVDNNLINSIRYPSVRRDKATKYHHCLIQHSVVV